MKNSRSLRIALVGIGNICLSAHAPMLKTIKANVTYGIDINDSALKKIQNIFPDIKVTKNLSEINQGNIDCAIISSPTGLHYEQVKQFLNKGVNVLCEKPLALSEKEARELANLSHQHNLVLQVGYYRRFQAATQYIRQMIKGNNFGNLQSCFVLAGHIFSPAETPPSLTNKKLSGGGCLIDFGVHAFDTLKYWFDELHIQDYYDDNRGGIEANALVYLIGKIATEKIPIQMNLSRTNNLGYLIYLQFKEFTVIYRFNTGHKINLISRPIEIFHINHYMQDDIMLEIEGNHLIYFEKQWREFIKRISGSEEQFSNLNEAVITTSLVESCYKDRKELKLPWENIINLLNP